MNSIDESRIVSTAAVFAGAMIALFLPIVAAADTYTDGHGQTWTYSVKGRAATLTAVGDKTLNYPAEDFPWMFANDGTNYTVTALGGSLCKGWEKLSGSLSIPATVKTIGNETFNACKGLTAISIDEGVSALPNRMFYSCSNLGGSLIVPHSVTAIGSQAFLWVSTKMTSAWFKGPEKVSSGEQGYTSIACGSGNIFYSSSNLGLKVALFGPYTMPSGVNAYVLYKLNKCIVYLPRNGYWLDENLDSQFGGTKTILFYGPGEELDISIDETRNVFTATPTTVNALTNVLSSAATFKSDFGLDTRISMTNSFEYSQSLFTGLAAQGVTFERVFFAVKTQAVLSDILSVFPAATTIAIDPAGLKETLTVPGDRDVVVKVGNGYKVRKLQNGFEIAVKRRP